MVPSIESGPPGISIGLSGTCWWLGIPNEAAFIRLARIVTDGELPFDTSIELPVRSNGSFSGQLVVPVEAPQGEYTLSLNCRTEDQFTAFFDTTFTVAGDPITTTSTSSTTTTVVQPPGGGGASIEPPIAPPAIPSPGTPTYTG